MIDYLNGHDELRGFYLHQPDLAGIKNAIALKKNNYTQRTLLYTETKRQYLHVDTSEKVANNIQALQEENTFTVCTAHQPCLFTGPLYFIYKILHACKLAEYLNSHIADYRFVPIYYMGAEDADLEELGTVHVQGKKYQWLTNQKGAVGRMKVDEALLSLIEELNGQLSVTETGKNHLALLYQCFQPGVSIATATFLLVNELFKEYGLVVLNPDQHEWKKAFVPIMEKELLEEFSHQALNNTIEKFPVKYKVQSAGRPINLFYLDEQLRSRIEKKDSSYAVVNTPLQFTVDELLSMLKSHPEKFSPNVILRPLLQEYLLPNVAFIGGGGELAYWLELKEVFGQADIAYPVLLLRNSFSLLSEQTDKKITSLGLTAADFFMGEEQVQKKWLQQFIGSNEDLTDAIIELNQLYKMIQEKAVAVDVTLQAHVESLKVNAEKKLLQLDKKIYKAQKKKHETDLIKIQKIFSALYPNGQLQERVENYFGLPVRENCNWMDLIFKYSQALEQQFCVIAEK